MQWGKQKLTFLYAMGKVETYLFEYVYTCWRIKDYKTKAKEYKYEDGNT